MTKGGNSMVMSESFSAVCENQEKTKDKEDFNFFRFQGCDPSLFAITIKVLARKRQRANNYLSLPCDE